METKNKRQLGQFFTTNCDYILNGFSKYVKNQDVQDPFAGGGDLLRWAITAGAKSVKGFDIDDRYIDNQLILKNDSLASPQKYNFIITNPPYLYVNKVDNDKKKVFSGTANTDLYQIAIEKIMDSQEGIVIVPINFLSAENSKYIRNKFFCKFDILKVNYFTEQVFSDTTYNVIAFYYKIKKGYRDFLKIPIDIYPEKENRLLMLEAEYDWQIGGEFLDLVKSQSNSLGVHRLMEEDLKSGNIQLQCAYNHLDDKKTFYVDNQTAKIIRQNIILLKAIDTGSSGGDICLEDIRNYGLDALVSIITSRNQIFMIFDVPVEISEQEKIIQVFNNELKKARDKYYSLFMTNYRDKNRKRISFDFAYKLINYVYYNKIGGNNGIKEQHPLFEAVGI